MSKKKIKIKLPKKNFFLMLLIALILLLFFSLIELPSLEKRAKLDTKALKIRAVPELAGILSQSQETRLKATRTLAERVGVEEALEIVKDSGLPATGEGHLAVHQIGFYAYKKYGKDAILHCKDYFLNACYHGAIIEAATDHGFKVIGEMVDRCKENPARHFQCAHAGGHAILAIWNYDLPKALKTCDGLFENSHQKTDTLSSCHNGAFMENLFGVHDWGKGETPKRDWLSSDMFFPCNAFGEKYQKGCWLNQAARIYQMLNGDLSKTAQTCQIIGNFQYTAWCMDNLARQIHPLTEGNINKVFDLCRFVGFNWVENCIVVNAGSYYSVGDRLAGINICNQVSIPAKEPCFQQILGQMLGDSLSDQEKKALCQKMKGAYENRCFSQVIG